MFFGYGVKEIRKGRVQQKKGGEMQNEK